MKKQTLAKSGALAGGMLLAASLLSGCHPITEVPALYGPPPELEETEPPVLATENIPEPVYGPPADFELDYDPANNIPEDVYGPPSFFGLEDEEPEESEEVLP